jgi:hypothetical protein
LDDRVACAAHGGIGNWRVKSLGVEKDWTVVAD